MNALLLNTKKQNVGAHIVVFCRTSILVGILYTQLLVTCCSMVQKIWLWLNLNLGLPDLLSAALQSVLSHQITFKTH